MQIPQLLLNHLNTYAFFDEASFVASHALPAPTSVRLNSLKPIGMYSNFAKVPWCTDAFYLPTRPQFIHDALWHAGAYYVQEASSMFLQKALLQHIDFSKPLRVLDLCAAPGGKSTLVANLLKNESLLISNEVIQTRVNILAENIAKWGRTNTWVSNSDPKYFASLENYFDVILVDAPCSGSGLFRKDAAAINEWSEENVKHCSLRQQRILQDVLPALKNNGVLVYMTCSYSGAENETIVDACLEPKNNLESLAISDVTQYGIIETKSEKHAGFGYRFMPNTLQGEGFFLAAFQKNCLEETVENISRKKVEAPKLNMVSQSVLKDWIVAPEHVFVLENENIFAIHAQHIADLHVLKNALKLVRKGTFIGVLKGKQLIPEHDLALSNFNVFENRVAVSNDVAIAFMQKNNFDLPECKLGWTLLTVNNLGIGWIKNLGNRFNNYFPKNMRVRKEM